MIWGTAASAVFFGLAACGDGSAPAPLPTAQQAASPAAVGSEAVQESSGSAAQPEAGPTAEPAPTATATPALAGTVNGQPILLTTYETELLRYEQGQIALGLPLEENYRTRVFLQMVEQRVIEQAAAALGIVISPDMVQTRIAQLVQEVNGQENFSAWLDANQITQDEFFLRLQNEMLTEAVVAEVTRDVPAAVEQVRALHIEVTDPTLAQSLVDQARSGVNFSDLARANSINPSAQVGGDLGYFFRGSLFVPELEEPAFALQPGQTSEVIPAATGNQPTYHILQVVERDPARPLTAEQRYLLLRQRFEQWLTDQLANAEVVRYVE